MSTVEEILIAASQLDPTQFLQLRQELDRLEQDLWETELADTTAELERQNLTDDEIDRLVLRRRRESRR